MFSRKLFSATLVLAVVVSYIGTALGQLGTAGISGQVLDRETASITSKQANPAQDFHIRAGFFSWIESLILKPSTRHACYQDRHVSILLLNV